MRVNECSVAWACSSTPLCAIIDDIDNCRDARSEPAFASIVRRVG